MLNRLVCFRSELSYVSVNFPHDFMNQLDYELAANKIDFYIHNIKSVTKPNIILTAF